MNYSSGKLSDFFKGVVLKKLTPTEVDPSVSHGHEYQGVKAFIEVFGAPENGETIYLDFKYLYLSDEETNLIQTEGQLSCYDSRWNKPRSAEYRLYYKDNEVTKRTKAGDYLILAKKKDDSLWAIVIEAGSQILSDVLLLFDISQEADLRKFNEIPSKILRSRDVPPSIAWLLTTLGITLHSDEDILNEMIQRFKGQLPTTSIFSAFARSMSKYTEATDANADDVIVDWYNTEEYLFHIFETYLINNRLNQPCTPESLLEYAKSVLNRRKSRAGKGLENHLEKLFISRNIKFSRTPLTEGKSRPDFLFPSIEAYKELQTPEELLHMLGVKTTCKDRWRQILVEADRLFHKHKQMKWRNMKYVLLSPIVCTARIPRTNNHGS